MNLETLRNNSNKILSPEVKDQSGLSDFQKTPDNTSIAIDLVGIERFRLPIKIEHPGGELMGHDAHASMFVYLEAGKTGVNMSRFCTILQEETAKSPISNDLIANVLARFRKDLRDYDNEKLIPRSQLILEFSYPTKQQSLKSENWGWQYYDIVLKGNECESKTTIELTLKYEYSSTCPCSLSLAKQYEQDYRDGKTTEGSGIASAHSQRSIATVTTEYNLDSDFTIESLIQICRKALPTETQSLVKRVDEQAFAILNGDNPMFVEHATRRLSMALNSDKRILDWTAKVEHIESLHSHNAVAVISKTKNIQ